MEISDVIAIVQRAKEGDQAAFEQLVRAYSAFVYSLAFRILGKRTEADDVFQETFIRAWRHLASFRTSGNFTHWIKRIATNVCMDRLKAQKRQDSYLTNAEGEEIGGLVQESLDAERQEAHDLVDELLSELPSTHRVAVVLFYLEERSVEEVARALKQNAGTVKVWLFRAREKMKAALEARGNGIQGRMARR